MREHSGYGSVEDVASGENRFPWGARAVAGFGNVLLQTGQLMKGAEGEPGHLM